MSSPRSLRLKEVGFELRKPRHPDSVYLTRKLYCLSQSYKDPDYFYPPKSRATSLASEHL